MRGEGGEGGREGGREGRREREKEEGGGERVRRDYELTILHTKKLLAVDGDCGPSIVLSPFPVS